LEPTLSPTPFFFGIVSGKFLGVNLLLTLRDIAKFVLPNCWCRLIPFVNNHIPVYNQALLQELSTQYTGVIQCWLLPAQRELLPPTDQKYYKTSLAEQLFVSILSFVNDHSRGLTNNTHAVINMVLLDLWTQGTTAQMMYAQIIDQIRCSNQQDFAMIQYHAFSTMFHNSNQVRYQSHQFTRCSSVSIAKK
jgi:hypothetical protein